MSATNLNPFQAANPFVCRAEGNRYAGAWRVHWADEPDTRPLFTCRDPWAARHWVRRVLLTGRDWKGRQVLEV